MAMESRSASLSSPAILFARSAPHCEHLWTIDHSPFCLTQTATGSMADLQIERLSPDWKSTCLLHRHRGQWFLWFVPDCGLTTSWWQLMQSNVSSSWDNGDPSE
jgi:hypothetical protein